MVQLIYPENNDSSSDEDESYGNCRIDEDETDHSSTSIHRPETTVGNVKKSFVMKTIRLQVCMIK